MYHKIGTGFRNNKTHPLCHISVKSTVYDDKIIIICQPVDLVGTDAISNNRNHLS